MTGYSKARQLGTSKKRAEKKQPLKALRKEAWVLQSRYIRQTEGRCYTCGAVVPWKEMDLGHFIHKASMDFVREGLHAQCTTCNRWKHGNHAKYAYELIKQYGPKIIAKLVELGNQVRRYSREELEAIRDKYKNLLSAGEAI